MNLSEHFTLGEMTKSQTALRLGIDNDPDEDAVENLTLVCESILEPVREYYDIPFSPSSAYRCPELNRNVGSANTSQHISGKAIDFEIPGVPNMGLAQWIMDNLDYDQLILEFYKEGEPNSGWVHCSYRKEGNRNDAKRFDGTQWVPLGVNLKMFPALFGLGKLATSIAGIFAPSVIGDAITAAGALNTAIGQLNYDPKDLSLGEEILGRAKLATGLEGKGIGSLFTQPVTSGGEGGGGGGGGGGGDGGTDTSGRPFFDPGLGSPAQNIQSGGTGAQAGVQPVTTQPLAPPPALPGIPSEADFSAGFDFGTDFGFNQGGLVSLLPRRATPVRSPPISYRRY